MADEENKNSIVMLPFLKTSSPISIGQLTFRSTDDLEGLTDKQSSFVQEIARMLFLQDNLRIKSASYAIVPFIELYDKEVNLDHIINIQNVISYFYASPRHDFGDLFLSSEHASVVILSPDKVPMDLVHPEFNTISVHAESEHSPDNYREIGGYTGLYNFINKFWVSSGSRLYGPKRNITLNICQDLREDFEHSKRARADYRLLAILLNKPQSRIYSRIFTSLRWFNAANNAANNDSTAIVNLSIGFESLLSLPSDEKTNRLIDSISLLLGRIPRLEVWANQFYKCRSKIVHEGFTEQLLFNATDLQKDTKEQSYQSLLSYGRRVFQLCLGTLLCGAELSENSDLEETFVTNQERFLKICKVLSDNKIPINDRLKFLGPIIFTIHQYQFISERNLKLETMLNATCLAAKVLLEYDGEICQDFKEHLQLLINAENTKNHFPKLNALHNLSILLQPPSIKISSEASFIDDVKNLIKIVWHTAFRDYFRIKQNPDEVNRKV